MGPPSSSARSARRVRTTRARGRAGSITVGFSTVLRLGFGLQVSDTHGMKAMRRATVEPIVRRCRNGTDLFDTELVLRADRAGLSRRRGPGDGRGASPVAHAHLPARPPDAGRTRPARGSSSGGTTDVASTRPLRRRALGTPRAAHAVGEVAGQILDQFGGDDPDLVVCFASPHFVGTMDDLAFALRNLLTPRAMLGMTAVAVVAGTHEVEDGPALSVFAASLPDAQFTPLALGVEPTPDGTTIAGWPEHDRPPSALLLLADPFTFPPDGFLHRVNDDLTETGDRLRSWAAQRPRRGARAGTGCCSTTASRRPAQSASCSTGVAVQTVVSQGCRPSASRSW